MKNKFILSLIVSANIIPPVFAFQIQVSEEIKNFGIMFAKFSLGVVIASFAIGIILWIISLFMKNKVSKEVDSKVQQYKCMIDDTNTIDEAINSFLTINND